MSTLFEHSTAEYAVAHRREHHSPCKLDMHIHDTHEILCFVSGNANYLVEGQYYKLRPGSIMLMRSAENHCLILKSSGIYDRYVINFDPEALIAQGFSRDLLRPFTDRALGERNLYLPTEFEGVSPQSIFEKMEREAKLIAPDEAVRINLAALLSALCSAFMLRPQLDPPKKNYVSDAIIDYVNEHLLFDLSLEKLSERFHLSTSQINRLFRQSTGTSVYHYIATKRLIMAQEMIAKGENATAAAQQCCFHDYSSFYRLYKKQFGVAPSAVRKKLSPTE